MSEVSGKRPFNPEVNLRKYQILGILGLQKKTLGKTTPEVSKKILSRPLKNT